MIPTFAPIAHQDHIARLVVGLQYESLEIRLHLFAYDRHLESIIASPGVYAKEELEKDPSLLEAVRRKDALEGIQEMKEKLIVARRLTANDPIAAGQAFGAEQAVPRDLAWVDTVATHLKRSFGMPTPNEPAPGLWYYDLNETASRLGSVLAHIGINITSCFPRQDVGEVTAILKPKPVRVVYFDPELMLDMTAPGPKDPKLQAIFEAHMAMLKVYKSLLALAHSWVRKRWSYASKKAIEDSKELREAGGFPPVTYYLDGQVYMDAMKRADNSD